MLLGILVIQIVLLLVILALFFRRSQSTAQTPQDPRLLQLADSIAPQLTRVDARAEALDSHVRGALDSIRGDLAREANASREANNVSYAALRTEITHSVSTLGSTLHAGLADFRSDNTAAAAQLRTNIQQSLDSIAQRLASFIADNGRYQLEAQGALHTRLADLGTSNTQHQEGLRTIVQERLDALNTANAAKLEEMRATVDEKLQSTLNDRLTKSFGQVTDQLNKVHTGLGQMAKLSEGVDGLSRIFTNVKSRGGFAEIQLGMLLKQMLAPGQYIENATVKPGGLERVEFAIRFPANSGERLMPIDAKFPREAWERLENAYESNLPDAIQREGKAFESAIRIEADRICSKYINPPVTTPYAVMFLPTEGLYAEVIRRNELQSEIQSKCHVTIAGPTTLAAILTSFQMGFHMLALQEKGDEVWKVLESTKTEFKTFERLMTTMERQVGTVQNTIQNLGVRTRAINRTLRDVSDPDSTTPFLLEDLPNVIPLIAASNDELGL